MSKKIIFKKELSILFENKLIDFVISLSEKDKKFIYYSESEKKHIIKSFRKEDLEDYSIIGKSIVFSESVEDVLNFKNEIELYDKFPYVFIRSKSFSSNIILDSSKISKISKIYFMEYEKLGFYRASHGYDYDLSIIVPVYGVEDFVEKCAKSLMEQDFCGKYEVLFIDDGSKDNSVSKLKNILYNVPHMKILTKENGGAASARNYGMNYARGEYISFVDGDDYVSQNYVSVLYRNALLNNSDISQASFSYVNISENSSHKHKEYFHTSHDKFSDIATTPYELMLQTPGIWRRAYRKKFLEKNNIIFNEKFRRHDDLPFNIEVLTKAEKVSVADDVIYYYILGRDGQDVGATDERLFIHFDLFDDAIKLVQNKYWNVGYYRIFIIVMFSHHLWAYNRINKELKNSYLHKMGSQIFLEPGPIGPLGRLRILTSFFNSERNIIMKCFLSTLSKEDRPIIVRNFLGYIKKH